MNNVYTVFTDFFGTYEPCVSSFSAVSGSSITTTYEVSTNWGYIGSVVLFIVFLYCILRVLGGIICAK